MFNTFTSNNNSNANNNNNNNNRSIPSVSSHLSRRSNNSAVERKLEEVLQILGKTNESLEQYKTQCDRVTAECQELKARLNNKPAAEKKHGFPGSKVELKQIRVSINTC